MEIFSISCVSSRISRRGGGVSQAIGTGGRDLSSTVAGRTTRSALSALDADDETDVIVLISKPPAENAIDAINDTLAECSTPVIAHFQGVSTEYDQLQMADSLRATADDALSVVGADGGRVDVTGRGVRPVGYLPQQPSFRPGFSVVDTLRFYADLLGPEAAQDVDVDAVLGAPVGE